MVNTVEEDDKGCRPVWGLNLFVFLGPGFFFFVNFFLFGELGNDLGCRLWFLSLEDLFS